MIEVWICEREDQNNSKSIRTRMPELPSIGNMMTFFQRDGKKCYGTISIIEHVFDKQNNFMYVEITVDDGD